MPISPTIPQEEEAPAEAAPSETSKPSPSHQETEPMDADPILAYYDSDPEEKEERLREEKQNQEGRSTAEETPVAEPIHHEMARGDIDLNESAKKQGLMTDEEFDLILNRVSRREDNAAPMAEGLDLALRAVGEMEEADTVTTLEGQAHQPLGEVDEAHDREKESESVDPQQKVGEGEIQVEEEGPITGMQEPGPVAPPVLKPIPVKRQLILKGDPKAERPKPTRVSQRCLGKWAASKAKANTAETPVEIESEGERPTPTKPGEELLPATDLEDAAM